MRSNYVYRGNDIYRGIDPCMLKEVYEHREPPPVNDIYSAADSHFVDLDHSKHDIQLVLASRRYEREAQIVQELVTHLAEANKKLLVAMSELKVSLDEATKNRGKSPSSY